MAGESGKTGGPRRRGRPRLNLTREDVVGAALALVDAEGFEALSMPRVARRLGVSAMSLYGHVEGRDDLLQALVDRVLAAVETPDGAPDDWEVRVVGFFRALRRAALAHPAVVRVLAVRGVTSPAVFRHLAVGLSILRAAGFSDGAAVRAWYALLTTTLGFVAWEVPRSHEQPPGAYAAAWDGALDGLPAAERQLLAPLRDHLVTVASEHQFQYTLSRLVAALRADRRGGGPGDGGRP